MNIIICGSSGMLGHTLKKYLKNYYNIFTIDRSDINLSSIDTYVLSDHIKNLTNPTHNTLLINCVGLIKQRQVPDHEMIDINGVLPHKLSYICNALNIKMIHFSTDCVYSGDKGSYVETDPHDAKDIYGLSKSLGEPRNCTVIRTSIIGEEEKNKLSLVEWVKSNKNQSVNGFTNHFWNGVTCLQAGKIVQKIINENLFWHGTRHVYSDILNKYDLVSIINNTYKLNINIKPTQDKETINRTLSSTNDITNFNIPKLHTQIEEMRDFYAA